MGPIKTEKSHPITKKECEELTRSTKEDTECDANRAKNMDSEQYNRFSPVAGLGDSGASICSVRLCDNENNSGRDSEDAVQSERPPGSNLEGKRAVANRPTSILEDLIDCPRGPKDSVSTLLERFPPSTSSLDLSFQSS
eukprot:CAMPEP_0183302020 /NCGR_PEP_ID=MMETSP0160_2-20130417/7957_1 /TAXON_ID=2839 ORGANISM="Odontella Sinensis, Strain Grunow 1884" /NCGR_SAMPLE_ID=MMETSP0160_2 /ASSEMBLY_ACC=CAM_ASM_000250 /LENGTH=138 /DNA_ID=CAMNT_0025464743 /DNA_START=100 /DNA_END=513 /DNA_ORIENTATION=-